MAKNFVFKTEPRKISPNKTLHICTDICNITGNKIGSFKCLICLTDQGLDFTSLNLSNKTISCPKIIYRHANGKVIMRKK